MSYQRMKRRGAGMNEHLQKFAGEECLNCDEGAYCFYGSHVACGTCFEKLSGRDMRFLNQLIDLREAVSELQMHCKTGDYRHC